MTKRFFSAVILTLILSLLGTHLSAMEPQLKSSQIIIGYTKNTDPKDIKALEEKFKLKAVKQFKRIFAICYQTESTSDIKGFIQKIQQEDIVRYAERNGKITANK